MLTHHKKSVRGIVIQLIEYSFVTGSASGNNIKEVEVSRGCIRLQHGRTRRNHQHVIRELRVYEGVFFSASTYVSFLLTDT
jgi:pleiotropic regulator 1